MIRLGIHLIFGKLLKRKFTSAMFPTEVVLDEGFDWDRVYLVLFAKVDVIRGIRGVTPRPVPRYQQTYLLFITRS